MSQDNELESAQNNQRSSQSDNSEGASEPAQTVDNARQDPSTSATEWSWGAFMFDAPFLIAIQKYEYLLIYLLMFIPILNFIVYIGLKIYLGLKGRKMARNSVTFTSAEQRRGFFKGFDWSGKVVFFIMLGLFVLGLLLTLVFGISAMNAVSGAGFSG